MWYQGYYYYYMTNLQGDITAMVDHNGNPVAYYHYDAWGNHLYVTGTMASTLGQDNPLRYRGYVYDNETGLYYLQSRYYNPEWGRFINSDSLATTGQGLLGNNMFAYCNNNPIIYQDSAGDALETVFDVISLSASIAEVAVNPYDLWAWLGLFGDAPDVAIPCVGGLGEAVDAIRTAVYVAETTHGVSCLSELLENGITQIAGTATAGSSNARGAYGELLAGNTGTKKTSFEINGRIRISDGLTPTKLTEVKNVARISNTLQLQDYAQYAKDTNRALELIVRRTTNVAQSGIDAGWKIRYLW